jgi:broad specificity phosphatase PhoE
VVAAGLCTASVASFGGGESPKRVSLRADEAFQKALASVGKGKVVAAVSHGALLRVLLTQAFGNTAISELGNAVISVLDVNADWRVTGQVLDYAEHLGQL